MPLPFDPAPWARQYIGMQFKPNGRGRDGVDCWGLVRLAYLDQYGVLLANHASEYAGVRDDAGVPRVVENELGNWSLVGSTPQRVGDVGLFRIERGLRHVGVAIAAGRMLHIEEGLQGCVEEWDHPNWLPRLIGWYQYAGGVSLGAKRSEWSDAVALQVVPTGGTLDELRLQAQVADLPGVRCWVAGREVPRAMWPHVRPKAGRVVTFGAAVAGGGGSKTAIRIVATIALIAAAVYTGGALYGASGVLGTSAVGAATVTAGITITGSLLLNALVPIPGSRLTENSARRVSSAIAGTRNEARQYGPTNIIVGITRITPAYAAMPYTENVGDDQYLRCVFDIGAGPISLWDFKLGDTPLSEFDGVEIETREGWELDRPLSLFPGQVVTQALNVLLLESDSWQVRTSGDNAEELRVDLTWPRGLAHYGSNGDRDPLLVQVEMEYRKVGDATWQRVNGAAPLDEASMPYLFRSPEATVTSTGIHTGTLQWSADGSIGGTKPAYLPAANFSWEVTGYYHSTRRGVHTFAVDGADAVELEVAGRIVASWYGDHAPAGSGGIPNFSHTGDILLGRPGPAGGGSYVPFRLRVAVRSGGSVAVGVRGPDDASLIVIPAERLRQTGQSGSDQGLAYRALDTSGYTSLVTVNSAQTEPIRRTTAWSVAKGQYEVRMRRITPDRTDEADVDQVYWTSMQTIRNAPPVKKVGRALVALRIKASDQLAGVVDDFNCMAGVITADYEETSGLWIDRVTNTPASNYRMLLEGRGTGRPVDASRINLAKLAEWAVKTRALGLTCNGVIDFPGTVFERLRDIAATGRASFALEDNKYSVTIDEPQTVPVQMITARNSADVTGRIAFPDPPHAFRARFINSEIGFQQDEQFVYADGYSKTGSEPGMVQATRFETIELFLVTRWSEIYKACRYFLAVAKLRPEIVEVSQDIESLVARRGKLILVNYDVMLNGLGSGRIKGLQYNTAGELSHIGVDVGFSMEAGKRYGVVIRSAGMGVNGWMREVVTPAISEADVRWLEFVPHVPDTDPWPETGDLVAFGELGKETREMIVRSIEPGADLSARLSLVDHAPAIAASASGPIPDYDPNITQPPNISRGPSAPVVLTIQSDDYVLARDSDGSFRVRMLITMAIAQGTAREATAQLQVRTRPKAPVGQAPYAWTIHAGVPADSGRVFVEGVVEGTRYQIDVRAIATSGRTSRWVDLWTPTPPDPDADGTEQRIEHTVLGKTLPPPDVLTFNVYRLSDGTRRYAYTQVPNLPPDLAGVLIYYGVGAGLTWDQLQPLHTGVLEGASPTELNVPPAGTYTFGIKNVDTSGNQSVNAVLETKTLGPARQEGIVAAVDAKAEGFPGTKENCYVDSLGNLSSKGQSTWADIPSAWSDWHRWNLHPFPVIVYTHTSIDMEEVLAAVPTALVSGEGIMLVEARWSLDDATWSDWGELATFIEPPSARYWQFRITCTQPSGTGDIPRITQAVFQLRATTIVWDVNDFDTAVAVFREGPGDFRIPLPPGMFAVVRGVSVMFNGMGQGWSSEIVDRDVDPGPRLRLFNASGTGADALVDLSIRGLAR